jgi:hypothetical protein
MTTCENSRTGRLTPQGQRRSVRTMDTSGARSKRGTGKLARACGLVAILALIVAPTCAPLCAARICSQASAPTTAATPCHLAGLMHGGESQFHAVQNCGASELPAAVLTSSIRNDAMQASSAAAIDAAFGILPREFFTSRLQQSERSVVGPLSPHLPSTLLSDPILRI